MSEWKFRRWKKIKIEGFQLHRFISAAATRGIGFRGLRMVDECQAEAQVDARQFAALKKAAGNRYRITVVGQFGLESRLRQLLHRTATCVGLLAFFAIIYYQSCFISEVQITGYEHLTEEQIRKSLAELGFYPGALKSYDLADLKTSLYSELGDIAWVGITYQGTLARVEILEAAVTPEREDTSETAHIVADRSGYIESMVVKEGVAQKQKGDFVQEGDLLISGLVPITDKSYTRKPDELFRSVHAQGEVKARVLYRIRRYQPAYSVTLAPTGRRFPGLRLKFGQWQWDSDRLYRPFEVSRREEATLMQMLHPLPVQFALYWENEVEVCLSKRLPEEIQRRAQQQCRQAIKEILPKDGQFVKNDLSFSEKENIIEVTMLIHSIETIGTDQPFSAPVPEPSEQEEAPAVP